ncbi:methionine gamma-lyase [Aliikangiella coralliicola]|uniref:L-methionine gamma-lyase n=1 Tax=Aliikangiella coralliicola TaxID=2592383 RepID=A0A545TWH0_9GAMM|nr:methionine gamma-lyase [Aliikangiella coralliicola]TQV81567.1 methionine gamma-lyase [Aliikangiella coralliicola]
MTHSKHVETKTIHAGKIKDAQFGALSTPIYQTSTFIFDNVQQGAARFMGEEEGFIYGRLGNPTVRELERRMAALELTEDAAAFGSGMGAVSATLLANLSQGDHIVASAALYGCTFALLNHKFPQFGIEVSFVDMTDEEAIRAAIKPNTKVIYFETPINPNLVIIDIAKITSIAKEHQLVSIVDNTFMSPALQTPAEFGIDLIIHSATKYLNGHGDVIAGITCGSKEQIENIKLTTLKDMGAVMSPNDAWLIIRGLKTLSVRVERHCSNAQKVAEFLETHPRIRCVNYPGLPSHQGFPLIGKQMQAGGGIMAFEIEGTFDDAVAFMNSLEMCSIAVSLGDAESLIQHPASMTHSPYEEEERASAGISETLVRLSVGLENIEDIICDLTQALEKMDKRIKQVS